MAASGQSMRTGGATPSGQPRQSPVQRIGALLLGVLDAAIGAASRLPAPPARRRGPAAEATAPQPADLGLGLKILVGAIVGAAAVGIVGPIVLAIVVGLAGGH